MEGPSLIILKEEVAQFKGKRIIEVSGNTKINLEQLLNQPLNDIKTWGKHFLLVFNDFSIRIHFLMFGSYRINETKNNTPRLHLQFKNGELNFYTCAITVIEEDLNTVYDWSADVMSEAWDSAKARKKLRKQPLLTVSDALLDQTIFAGVGNIIKNEALYRIHVHPESVIGALPPRKLTALVTAAYEYSQDFYRWKKAFELKKHWLVYTKKKCPQCKLPVIKKYTGKTLRRSFFCPHCQVLYTL